MYRSWCNAFPQSWSCCISCLSWAVQQHHIYLSWAVQHRFSLMASTTILFFSRGGQHRMTISSWAVQHYSFFMGSTALYFFSWTVHYFFLSYSFFPWVVQHYIFSSTVQHYHYHMLYNIIFRSYHIIAGVTLTRKNCIFYAKKEQATQIWKCCAFTVRKKQWPHTSNTFSLFVFCTQQRFVEHLPWV